VLKTVSVVPPPGAYWPPVQIPIMARDGSGIFCEGIDGLNPVAAEIDTTPYNFLDGEYDNGSRVGKRNIVLHLVMEPNPGGTLAQMRRGLYGYFMPQTPVTLQFDSDDQLSVQIDGKVESFDNDRFSNDPTVTISIVCPMPNFRATNQGMAGAIAGLDPDLTDVVYSGDRIVGFTLRAWMASGGGVQSDFHVERKIESSTPGVYFSTQIFKASGISIPGYNAGYVWLDTRPGSKTFEIRNEDDTTQTNLLGWMDDDSVWPVLYVADNKMRVVTSVATPNLNWALNFNDQYGGI
jgi:hypothetical protein